MVDKSHWTSVGALLPAGAAFLTASCCLPLGLGVLGLSSATLSQLIPLRPYLLGLTVALLAVAFYQTYKPVVTGEECAPGTACPTPVSHRWQRIFLWAIAAVSLVLATLPYWISWLIYWAAVLEG
ncbi:MAG TPA: mercuric transporter MerT family protein [Candidatus Acidoferrales bacterium]|nr:mercuric transporter MerT family protein [Candidatus Acidoferrales bacterium]